MAREYVEAREGGYYISGTRNPDPRPGLRGDCVLPRKPAFRFAPTRPITGVVRREPAANFQSALAAVLDRLSDPEVLAGSLPCCSPYVARALMRAASTLMSTPLPLVSKSPRTTH